MRKSLKKINDPLGFYYKREHAIIHNLVKMAGVIKQVDPKNLKWAVDTTKAILDRFRNRYGLVPRHLRDGIDALFSSGENDLFFFDHYFEVLPPEINDQKGVRISLRIGLQLCEEVPEIKRLPEAVTEIYLRAELNNGPDINDWEDVADIGTLTLKGCEGQWNLNVYLLQTSKESPRQPTVDEFRNFFSEFLNRRRSRISKRDAKRLIDLMVEYFISKQESSSS